MAHPKIVSRDEWLTARKALLAKEKELLKQSDALNAERRRLPMVEISKPYVFEGPDGKASLCDLFEGRKQLLVYHFMFDPNNPPPGKTDPFTEGCPGCSFVVDNLPHLSHLHARDTTLVLVSRAPQAKIKPFKQRMGWDVPWYSSFGSDFNYDFHVTTDEGVRPVEYNYKDGETLKKQKMDFHFKGEQPGLSAFLCVDGRTYHTYSTYARGLEPPLLTTYHLLDITAYGRQEAWEDSPQGWPQDPKGGMDWVRHHDKYGEQIGKSDCCDSKK